MRGAVCGGARRRPASRPQDYVGCFSAPATRLVPSRRGSARRRRLASGGRRALEAEQPAQRALRAQRRRDALRGTAAALTAGRQGEHIVQHASTSAETASFALTRGSPNILTRIHDRIGAAMAGRQIASATVTRAVPRGATRAAPSRARRRPTTSCETRAPARRSTRPRAATRSTVAGSSEFGLKSRRGRRDQFDAELGRNARVARRATSAHARRRRDEARCARFSRCCGTGIFARAGSSRGVAVTRHGSIPISLGADDRPRRFRVRRT